MGLIDYATKSKLSQDTEEKEEVTVTLRDGWVLSLLQLSFEIIDVWRLLSLALRPISAKHDHEARVGGFQRPLQTFGA